MTATPSLDRIADACALYFLVSRESLCAGREIAAAARFAYVLAARDLTGASDFIIGAEIGLTSGQVARVLRAANDKQLDDPAFRRRVLAIEADVIGDDVGALDARVHAPAEHALRAQLEPATLALLESERAALHAAAAALAKVAARDQWTAGQRGRLKAMGTRLQKIARDEQGAAP